MSKIVNEEFDICHQFSEEIKYFLPIEKKKYVEISHVVFCSDLVIFISYDKKNFSAEIKILCRIISRPKKVNFPGMGGRFTVR